MLTSYVLVSRDHPEPSTGEEPLKAHSRCARQRGPAPGWELGVVATSHAQHLLLAAQARNKILDPLPVPFPICETCAQRSPLSEFL